MSATALVSSEFLLLCQGQLSLLVQGVEASLAIVYLAEEWLGGQTNNLIPIVAYPDNAAEILRGMPLQLIGTTARSSDPRAEMLQGFVTNSAHQSTEDSSSKVDSTTIVFSDPPSDGTSVSESTPSDSPIFEATVLNGNVRNGNVLDGSVLEGSVLLNDVMSAAQEQSAHPPQTPFTMPNVGAPNFPPGFQQAVQPIYHDNRPVGVLVMARKGRPWLDEDYGQLERVSYTLSAACGMEHRLQWLQNRFQQQEIVQERQQDILDNLIHQFRNPLTALRTFGKLLVRRLGAEDPNQRVAEGIVRESDRLQALLKQMNTTVDHYGLPPAEALPPSTESSLTPPSEIEADIIEGNWEPGSGESPIATEIRDSISLPPETTARHASALPPASATPPANPLTGAPLPLEACNVAALLSPLLDSFGAIAHERGQTLQLQVHPPHSPSPVISQFPFTAGLDALADAFLVQGNHGALREVVSNLVDNGLKYGHPSGTVTVTVTWDDPSSSPQPPSSPDSDCNALSLCISDDGPGIPTTDLPRLFERHYRGIQAKGEKPGTGLGLAIAKDLVEQMGGRLNVFSPAHTWHSKSPPQGNAEIPQTLSPESITTKTLQQRPGSAFVVQLQRCVNPELDERTPGQ